MQNLWLKRCSCGRTAVEFRSRKDLYNDSVRKLYCPSCIKEAQEGTLMINIRKWGSTTSKVSDIGVYGIFYNVDMLRSRNDNYEWNEKEAIETFETGMVRPNLLSSVREDQDYHIYGLLKKGEDPIEYKKRKVSEFKKTAENELPETQSTDQELKALSEEKKELLDIADEVASEDLSGNSTQVQTSDSQPKSSTDISNENLTTVENSETEIKNIQNSVNKENDQQTAPVPLAEENSDSIKQEETVLSESSLMESQESMSEKTDAQTEKNNSGFFSKMFKKEEKTEVEETQTSDSPF